MSFLIPENYKHHRRKRELQSDIEDLDISESFSDNSESFNKLFSSSSHHISKRSESNKNYVELMVAADHLMLKRHGDKLQNYILTLVSIVSMAFLFLSV